MTRHIDDVALGRVVVLVAPCRVVRGDHRARRGGRAQLRCVEAEHAGDECRDAGLVDRARRRVRQEVLDRSTAVGPAEVTGLDERIAGRRVVGAAVRVHLVRIRAVRPEVVLRWVHEVLVETKGGRAAGARPGGTDAGLELTHRDALRSGARGAARARVRRRTAANRTVQVGALERLDRVALGHQPRLAVEERRDLGDRELLAGIRRRDGIPVGLPVRGPHHLVVHVEETRRDVGEVEGVIDLTAHTAEWTLGQIADVEPPGWAAAGAGEHEARSLEVRLENAVGDDPRRADDVLLGQAGTGELGRDNGEPGVREALRRRHRADEEDAVVASLAHPRDQDRGSDEIAVVSRRVHRDGAADLPGTRALHGTCARVREDRRGRDRDRELVGCQYARDEIVAVVPSVGNTRDLDVVTDAKTVVCGRAEGDGRSDLRRSRRASARDVHRGRIGDVVCRDARPGREQREPRRRRDELLRRGRREDRFRAVDVHPPAGVDREVARTEARAERREVDRVAGAIGLVVRDQRALKHLEERLRVDVVDDERRAEIADGIDTEREVDGLGCVARIDLRVGADGIRRGVAGGDQHVGGCPGKVGRRVDDELHRRLGVVVDVEVTAIDPPWVGGRRRVGVLVRRRTAVRRRLDVLERVVDLDRTARRQRGVRREICVRAEHVVDQTVDGDRAAVGLVRRARRDDERAGIELLVGRCRGRERGNEQQCCDRFAKKSPHGPASHEVHHHSRAYVPPVTG